LAHFPVEAVNTVEVSNNADVGLAQDVIDEYQNLKRYFERPRLYASTTASTRGNLVTYNVNNPVSNFWPASALTRLLGMFGYRATIKFTVTLASTPFQQGLVSASFQYGCNSFTAVNLARSNFPALVTNLPHVLLDFAEHTVAELVVPYMSPYEFFEIANTNASGGDNRGNDYYYGQFCLTQLLPYDTLPSSAAPTLRIYVSLHDMEFFGAVPLSANNVIPQSGVNHTSHMNAEAGDEGGKKPSEYLKAGSKVAKDSGTAAKQMGDTVSWYFGSLAETAESLGYSKPVNQSVPLLVQQAENVSEYHVDQPSNEVVVAPFQSNRLAVDSKQTGTLIDEMDFSFVLSNYSQAYVGAMTTADTAGTVLYATNLCPTSFWFRSRPLARPGGNLPLPVSASVTTSCFQPTTLCYISQMFKFWRGSIKLRFHFAKTKFHGGRVLAAYIPSTADVISPQFNSATVVTPEIAAGLVQPFQYSEIFDLRDNSVFEMTVPYVTSRPYISTLAYSGGVTLTVLDPLVTTGETSTSISYMIEVCGGDDFELANFIGSGLSPCNATNSPGGLVVFQSGVGADVCHTVDQYTVGERYNSLKQLLMIPTTYGITQSPSSQIRVSLPVFYQGPIIAATAPLPPTTSAYFMTSVQNVVCRLYAFMAGGTTYNVFTSEPSKNLLSIQQTTYDGGSTAPPFSDTRFKVGGAKPKVFKTGFHSTLRVKAPSFQKHLCIPSNEGFNLPNLTGTNFIASGSVTCPTRYYLESSNIDSLSNQRIMVTYSGSDDAHCWAFQGPPPCWLAQSTQSVSLDANFDNQNSV
jgi:hypothetical protein